MVTLLLNQLGGTNLEDRGDKTHISEEESQTWEAMLRSYILNAELAFRVLQSNNIFTNGPNIFADEFTSASGFKGTVNTGSTTAVYRAGTNDYALFGATGNTEGDAQNNVNIGNVNSVSVTGTIDSSTGFFSQIQFRPFLATSSNYTLTIQKGATTVVTKNINTTTTSIVNIDLVRSDYSQLLSNTDAFTITLSGDSGESFQYRTTTTNFTGTYFSWTGQNPIHSNTISGDWVTFTEYLEVASGAVVVVDTNTTSLDSNELGFAISNPDGSIPTNTGITATISDGTNSLTPVSLDNKQMGAIVGNPNTLSTGTAQCIFTLTSTDETNVTPTIKGYGIDIIR